MPTLVDSLLLEIKLDPSQFNREQKKLIEGTVKTRKELERQGKDIEVAGKRAADGFFGPMRRELLGLAAALVGFSAFKTFVSGITATDAATGRLARNVGLSTAALSTWQGVAHRLGGTAEGVNSTIDSFSNSLAEFRRTGTTGILPVLAQLGAAGGHFINPYGGTEEVLEGIGEDLAAVSKKHPTDAAAYAKALNIDPSLLNFYRLTRQQRQQMLTDVGRFSETETEGRAAQQRIEHWARLADIFTSIGRTLVTDLTPAMIGVNVQLERFAGWLDDIAKKNPEIATGMAAFLAVLSAGSAVGALVMLRSIARAFLGISAAETAATAAGGGFLATLSKFGRLGLLGAGIFGLYEALPKPLNEGEDEAARRRGLAARGLDPNGKPLQGGASSSSTETYIRQAAAARGINPDIAVAVARSEGLNSYTGDYGTSFGPFQLHYGGSGIPGMNSSGLGDIFTRQTGLNARDPTTVHKQIDFALDWAARHGWTPWHGWHGAPFAGIDQSAFATLKRLSGARVPNVATGAAGAAALSGSSYHSSVSNSSTEMNIKSINVHAHEGSARGIARDIHAALSREFQMVNQSNYGVI